MTKPASRGEQAVVRAEIAERVEECFEVLRRLPDRDRGRLSMQTLDWPVVVLRMCEDYPRDMKIRLPPPSAKQIARMEEVLDWMVRLAMHSKAEKDYAKAVYLCCGRREDVSAAARVMGLHRDTVRTYRDNGLSRIAALRSHKAAA